VPQHSTDCSKTQSVLVPRSALPLESVDSLRGLSRCAAVVGRQEDVLSVDQLSAMAQSEVVEVSTCFTTIRVSKYNDCNYMYTCKLLHFATTPV
jgi:hypothetical protein